MNYNVIDEMEKALNENNLGKARSILVNSVLWCEDEETIDRLNKLAIENGVFEDDNGEDSNKREKETLGEYIDRIRTEIMENFSKIKYEKIREYFSKYKKRRQTGAVQEEKSELKTILESGKQRDVKKKAAAAATVGLAAIAFGIKLLGKRKSNKR